MLCPYLVWGEKKEVQKWQWLLLDSFWFCFGSFTEWGAALQKEEDNTGIDLLGVFGFCIFYFHSLFSHFDIIHPPVSSWKRVMWGNFLRFHISQNIYILPSSPVDNLIGCQHLGWKLFSLSILKSSSVVFYLPVLLCISYKGSIWQIWNHWPMILCSCFTISFVVYCYLKVLQIFLKQLIKMCFSRLPNDLSSQLSSRKILGNDRSFALESIFSFPSELLLICWNKSLLFSRAEFIFLLKLVRIE